MSSELLPVEYIGSFKDVKECPELSFPEYCFIGRSNVGKSSIINCITGNKEIARTSKKPGKTQSINLFKVNEEAMWYIVDLPGYGYAKTSKTTRRRWSTLIDRYIINRENLMCTFFLVDIRHPMQENDRLFMAQLGENNIPFCILFTKSDKLKPAELALALNAYQKEILNEWEELPQIIVTSSATSLGREEIMDLIKRTNIIYADYAH